MKTVFIGDLHLQESLILPKIPLAGIDRVILLGDYVDQWNMQYQDWLYQRELDFLVSWCRRLRERGLAVTVLLGNHDIPYLIDRPHHYSAVSQGAQALVKSRLLELEPQVCARVETPTGSIVASHAGFAGDNAPEEWMFQPVNPDSLAELIPQLIRIESEAGFSRGGHLAYGSCVWADYLRDLEGHYNPDFPRQVVGHTPLSVGQTIRADNQLVNADCFSLTHDYRHLGGLACPVYDSQADRFHELRLLPPGQHFETEADRAQTLAHFRLDPDTVEEVSRQRQAAMKEYIKQLFEQGDWKENRS